MLNKYMFRLPTSTFSIYLINLYIENGTRNSIIELCYSIVYSLLYIYILYSVSMAIVPLPCTEL